MKIEKVSEGRTQSNVSIFLKQPMNNPAYDSDEEDKKEWQNMSVRHGRTGKLVRPTTPDILVQNGGD